MSRKMIVILLSVFLLSGAMAVLWAQEKAPDSAQLIVDAAVKKAAAENKVVFIHSSASW